MKRVFSHIRYFVALIVAIILLIFILPANNITRSLYDISGPEYHLLLLLVDVPLIVAWTIGMYGFTKISQYATILKGSPEANDFRQFSRGMGWFAWGLPGATLISTVLNAIGNSQHHFVPVAIIVTNYLYVVISVIALSYFGSAAHALALRTKTHLTDRSRKLLTLMFVVLGVIFCYVTVTKFHNTSLGNSVNVYYLPNWLIGITIGVPYLYAWFSGLLAAYELVLVARYTSGVLYKQALELLAAGLVTVIVALTGLQYFRSVIPRTGHLVIGVALLCTYAIYAVYLIGSFLLIYGTRRLKKIEEV